MGGVTSASRDGGGAWLPAAVAKAGFSPRDALVVATEVDGVATDLVSQGAAADGALVGPDAVVYTASLSKQVTATCAALLVQDGALGVEDPLRRWLPELPAWAEGVRVRHLVHHTSGLPDVCGFDELEALGRDRTTEAVMTALAGVAGPEVPPGAAFRYCNAGCVALARVVERAAGQTLEDLAGQRVFAPLGMDRTRFWRGPGRQPPGAAPTTPGLPAPLSVGDGGMWSTAEDLLRWNRALREDALGTSARVHAPGHLDDGTALDYAWGVDVRDHGGTLVHRHGGLWAGVSTQLLRVPSRRSSAAVLVLDDDDARTAALADAVLDHLIG